MVPAGLVGLVLLGSAISQPTAAPVQTTVAEPSSYLVGQTASVKSVQAPAALVVEPTKPTQQVTSSRAPAPSPQLSNDNYYTNVDGNSVHAPAYTDDDYVPAGASARCRDGTYSFSQNRRGTCSHHGGVAEWL